VRVALYRGGEFTGPIALAASPGRAWPRRVSGRSSVVVLRPSQATPSWFVFKVVVGMKPVMRVPDATIGYPSACMPLRASCSLPARATQGDGLWGANVGAVPRPAVGVQSWQFPIRLEGMAVSALATYPLPTAAALVSPGTHTGLFGGSGPLTARRPVRPRAALAAYSPRGPVHFDGSVGGVVAAFRVNPAVPGNGNLWDGCSCLCRHSRLAEAEAGLASRRFARRLEVRRPRKRSSLHANGDGG
jgi:hypothetical protein